VDKGAPMAELLELAIKRNIAPAYARKLLAAFPESVLPAIVTSQASTVKTQLLPEPLSEREIEVLRLMAEGCKYQEIAERLFISINTVRHHTRNVYSKLGANNRTQAIGRAKELNIL
jgi:LuxR family maltose regulon positive regulatory protein